MVDRPTAQPDDRPPTSDSGLAEIVARAVRNDAQAWQELLTRYAGRVFALMYSRVRDRDAAEELSQAVFVRVVEEFKRGRYREEGRFESWLFRIAMNLVRDGARRATTRGTTLSLRADETQADDPSTPPDLRPLRDAIGQLSDADQEIIHLRHHAGLPFQTVAELLDQPVGTLLARHHRAIAKLRAALETQTTTPHARGSA